MAAVAGFMAIAGSAVSAYGQYQAGKAGEKLGEYNAQIGEMKAKDALERGEWNIRRLNEDTRKLIGSQRVAFAASGVDITDPDSTAANVFADTAALSELDAQTIRMNAQREAWGHRAQAENDRMAGKIAKREGQYAAVGTLLSTGGNVLYGKYGFGAGSRTRNYSYT